MFAAAATLGATAAWALAAPLAGFLAPLAAVPGRRMLAGLRTISEPTTTAAVLIPDGAGSVRRDVIRGVYGIGYGELVSLFELFADPATAAAVESDLLRAGYRSRDIGTDRLSWFEAHSLVFYLGDDSALHGALDPEASGWTLQSMLIALIADALEVANWQRGGGKKADYPQRIPRPGVKPDKKQFGKGAIDVDEMAAWLGWGPN